MESTKADLKKAIDWTNEKIASPASDIATGELIVSELNAKIKALEDSKVVKTDRGALKVKFQVQIAHIILKKTDNTMLI